MLHVLVLFGRVPVGAGRETRRRQIVLAVALIVVGVHAGANSWCSRRSARHA